MRFVLIPLFLMLVLGIQGYTEEKLIPLLEQNAAAAGEAMALCHHYVNGWLAQADPETGLLPRNLKGDLFWNAKDAAADNYPFLVLTSGISGLYHLRRSAEHILEQEQRLASREDGLPVVYDFGARARSENNAAPDLIFGAAEYVKDGLMPVVEWMGSGPWLDRMHVLVRALYAEAERTLPPDKSPSENVEVCGDLMQAMSRLYWNSGDPWYKEQCFRLADRYLFERPVASMETIRLRDHGCEVIGGLSEIYVIAAREDADRHERYRPALYALLDLIMEKGINEDGMMPEWFNPKSGEQQWERVSDGWGYVYDAFLTVALVDNNERYRNAVLHALNNIHKYLGADWEGGSADGYADSIEGALNLLNRLPVVNAFEWVDQSMWHVFDRQRSDGILEGWHGDGNSARTSLMYALWKTQGTAVHPWREDVRLGGVVDERGALHLLVKAEWKWQGNVVVDRPRHREYLNLPLEYPRINQFPEWFTVSRDAEYVVQMNGEAPETVSGEVLWQFPMVLEPGQQCHLVITPLTAGNPPKKVSGDGFRALKYTPRTAAQALAWQQEVRAHLADLLGVSLKLSDESVKMESRVISEGNKRDYLRRDILLGIGAEPDIPAILTLPLNRGDGPFPAVVCIHGHGADRETVYEQDNVYHGFAGALAGAGVVTIAVDVGQHQKREASKTLMGERLQDLIRCVDYLDTLPEVDSGRIGCAGLSLGGEMAMWLGAMDTRIRATVSAGFLTFMNQMERNHCMCWKEAGMRELIDFPDIYALVAPRALMCQVGRQEPVTQFNTVLADRAFGQLHQTFMDLNAGNRVVLDIHEGGHEVDLATMVPFLLGNLCPDRPTAKI